MTTNDELIEMFREKLVKTGSLDAAFLKAAWVAYQRGIEDGKKIGSASPRDLPPRHTSTGCVQ